MSQAISGGAAIAAPTATAQARPSNMQHKRGYSSVGKNIFAMDTD